MEKLYQQIEHYLQQIDFNQLWEGFHPFPFALYNQEKIILNHEVLPYHSSFRGCTTIKFNEEQIAIWQISDKEFQTDPRLLTYLIVHEMFHAFQKVNHETRFPNDLVLLEYPTDLLNHQFQLMEHHWIYELMNDSPSNKRQILLQLIVLRTQREQLIGSIIHQEYLIETFEGMAEYIALKALLQLSYSLYEAKIQEYLQYLKEPDEQLFYPRKINYYTGALLLTALDQEPHLIKHCISKEKHSVYELIKQRLLSPDSLSMTSNATLCVSYHHYLSHKNELYESFSKEPLICYHGNYKICGYDPINMQKYDHHILCLTFICLKHANTNNIFVIDGPVLLHVMPDYSVINYQLPLKKALG